uniref:SFRICE_029536 n=1 Tax=Spodoptera frugiperda TaxID=7108 RepID=A0A2H1X3N6_SPOFR
MCYATLLWLRSASTNHIHWCKYSALVETDGRIKTHSLARRKKEVWIRMHVLSIYRKHELRIFLVQLHSIVSVETASLKPDVKQRLRYVNEVNGGPIPSFPIFPIPDSPTNLNFPKKAGNALVTPLVFQVSMGGGDCLPSVPWNSGAFFVPRIKNDFIITQKLAPLSELAIVVL